MKILGGVLMGAAGSATWDAVKWSSGIITKSAGKECEQYLRQHTAVSQERIAALADALFPVRKGSVDAAAPTRLLLSPGTEHRDLSASGVRLRQGWYPHDFRVLSAMSVFLGFSPTFIAANDLPAWVRGREVVLGTGSTTSSSIARALAGDPRLSYSYRLEELEERSVRVYSAALGREELKRLKRLVSILDGEELYHDRAHVDDQGWLKKDILLVTVAPHLDGGFDVVQLSGGHGAGTEAAKLMLDPEAFPDEDFWSFVRAVQEVRYFQAVLEVEDVERQGPDGATVGHGLRLSQLAPPRAVIRLPDLV